MQSSFSNKLFVTQHLSSDGTTVRVEGTKIKKKNCPSIFKTISLIGTITILELKSCRLKKLPAELSYIVGLRTLKIEDNLLTEIPSLESITELSEVSFSSNQLKLFPATLVKLEKLITLDLSHNPIACIPGAVAQMTSLAHLRIDDTALPYFPVSICPLSTKIVELCCGGNKIGPFPEQVLSFEGMRTLVLSGNNMPTISHEIGRLANLTHLDCSYNTITNLPIELCTLTKLRTLLLQHNKLGSLPQDIGNLTELTSLKLHDNAIGVLPESIGKLVNLVDLYLQENEFSTLPPQIGTCTSMRTLRLGYNKLTSLPDTLSRLVKLNVLMLHDNFLSEIPRALAQSQFLKHLLRVTLHNNTFSEGIQNDIATMGALHFLQENFAETSPNTQRKQFKEHALRRTPSRSLITRQHNRVPGLKSSNGSSASSANSDDSSAEKEEEVRKTPIKEVSIANILKVQARRRAISVGEALPSPSPSTESDSDSDNEFRPWKSHMEIRIRSGSVPNGTAPIPPYRSFGRVYEYLVDQLDLSEKRKEQTIALSNEEKWKLLSHLSRESSLNLLVNTKPKSAPGTPTLTSSPVSPNTSSPKLPPLSLLSVNVPSPAVSPQKSPRQPVFLSPTLRSPSVGTLQIPRHTYSADNIRGTRELLTTQSVAWITTFAETGGIEQILRGLENMSTKKSKTEDDYNMILEYLGCITIMIGIGLESLLISNAVEIMVHNIDSPNPSVREATVYVLDEVCNVFYSGQGLVIDGLTKLCKDESKRFLPLYSPLTSTSVHSMAMKAACMKLINNLITNTDDLEARCIIRNSFITLGLNDTLEQLRLSSGEEYQRLEQQIDHFEEVMNDDGEEIALRFKEGQVDIKSLPMFTSSRQLFRQGSSSGLTLPVVRVVLPSVSHRNMSCMIAQCPCDPNTSALDVVGILIKDNLRLLGLEPGTIWQDRVGDYGLWQMAHNLNDSQGEDEKVDLSAGWFLEDSHRMQPLALESVILDLRLRPWKVTILVDKSVYDLMTRTPKAQGPGGVKPLPIVPETQMEVEPKITCGSLMLQVLRKLYGDKSYEMEDLAFYMQPEKKVPDRTNKATSGGIWLESTAKLSDYGAEVTKTKLQLKRTPKILKLISPTDDSFEYVRYDEDTLIRTILQDTFQRIVAPSLTGQNRGNSPSHYGLFYTSEDTNTGEWLDPEKSLRSYEFPNRVPLRYLLKPKSLKIRYNPPPCFSGEIPKIENPQLVHFYVPIADVLSKLGISLEGCAVYLVNETAGDQYLDANLSLFNQNVPENSTISVKAATKRDHTDVNIWDEGENANTIVYNVENFNEIHAATINKLVERLTSEKDHDSDFTQVFEATYRTFMTHETLFTKLVERYIPPEHINPPALHVVRLRVIVFLKNWLEHSSNELPQSVMLNIEKFIDNQLCKGGHMNLAAQLKKMIQTWKSYNTGDSVRDHPEMNYQMSNPTKIIHGFSSLVDEWGLALQMTIRESKLFAQIKPVEFFKQKANDPIVAQMINNFNRAAAWVPVAILSEIKLVHRANAVERFIKLAWNLRQLKNFHLLTAVLSGLSNSAVLRLKWTFAKVAKRYKQMLEELESVMAMEGSFKNYRTILRDATPPCVPYMGVYLTDLVFIEDGNPDKIGNMVNWTKRRFMYNIISTFQRYQLTQYDDKLPSPSSPIHPTSSPGATLHDNKEANINTFLTFLNRMPILSDKQLYDMSMAREPRNCERRELM